jgi:predicted site-specific integrase-resolvase
MTNTGTARRGEPLKAVAQSFGASYDTFFRAYQAGKIKVLRFGKRLIVPASEIERLEREGLRTARPVRSNGRQPK